MPAPALCLHAETAKDLPPREAPAGRLVARGEVSHDAWRDLALHASEPNPFYEPWFMAAALAAVPDEQDVRLFVMLHGSRLLGLMPLTTGTRYGRLPIRFVQNWRHDQMFLGAPLIRKGHEQAFWAALLDTLDADGEARHFLHIEGLVEGGAVHQGLIDAAAARGRTCAVVHRIARALLESRLGPEAYYQHNVRKKKRKEIARLRNRLAEIGVVEARILQDRKELAAWCDAFLVMEQGGWKGVQGSALASRPSGRDLFHQAVAGAFEAGRLQFRRLDVGGRPVAMLVNFLTPPGSFSFKTSFDEAFARFSPGVLLQLDNLEVLARPDIEWMDSCASQNHPMIDSLWAERRQVVRVTVRLAGLRRFLPFAFARTLETCAARLKAARRRPSSATEPRHD